MTKLPIEIGSINLNDTKKIDSLKSVVWPAPRKVNCVFTGYYCHASSMKYEYRPLDLTSSLIVYTGAFLKFLLPRTNLNKDTHDVSFRFNGRLITIYSNGVQTTYHIILLYDTCKPKFIFGVVECVGVITEPSQTYGSFAH
jgi:hypothetical protein